MSTRTRLRWLRGGALLSLVAIPAAAAPGGSKHVTFTMVPSSGAIRTCLPSAAATVSIRGTRTNQLMTVKAKGLAPSTGYDLFVIQIPHAKFGISWYQSELETDAHGRGATTVRGIFSNETFTVSPDTVTTPGRQNTPQTGATFAAVNQYHLGLWFDDPAVPFALGCEPGQASPVVTPFNGAQHAGIQVLNTSNFPDGSGPLKQFSPSGAFVDGLG